MRSPIYRQQQDTRRERRAAASSRPRFGKIKQAVEYSSICRSELYNKAKKKPGLFVKDGAATRVNFDILDEILDDLPIAEIGKGA